MATTRRIPRTTGRTAFGPDAMPLDAARAAFTWLVTGPHPVSLDGRLFPGLPHRRVPLDELRTLLLNRRCPQSVRDAVWTHLVLLARTEGATWTVGAVGVALPGLLTIATKLTARFAGDPRDIHAAVLTGFVAELAAINLRKPRVMLRLRWAAYRAGHAAVREALDAPTPNGSGFRSAAPTPPSGHPDFVLARAVAEQVLTASEAELIAATRLEGVPLAVAADEHRLSYEAAKKVRQRAERRLVAYLRDEATEDATEVRGGSAVLDVAAGACHSVIITNAAERATNGTRPGPVAPAVPPPVSPSVTDLAGRSAEKVGTSVSPRGFAGGVQGCRRKPAIGPMAAPAHRDPTAPPDSPNTSARTLTGSAETTGTSGTTSEVARCA